MVKKQKELALKEQKLEAKERACRTRRVLRNHRFTAEEQKELASLEDINNALAKSASNSQTALK